MTFWASGTSKEAEEATESYAKEAKSKKVYKKANSQTTANSGKKEELSGLAKQVFVNTLTDR